MNQSAKRCELLYEKAFPSASADEEFFSKLAELELGILERLAEEPPQLQVRTLCSNHEKRFRALCMEARKRGK